ncbi:MAG TPA: serine/threonine-protein kinase [Thermoanaerobaculia bacterium]
MAFGSADATVQKPLSSRTSSPVSSGSLHHGRFLPGTILGDRFRIVALLGRGGMGEVFRADDLKLGQAVALKFLPPEVAQEPERLERLYTEVRTARQIAHPNVCRVYDVGEVNGEHFLSMEYIEGENLSTLLRRIGRLPETKAIQIARQMAAGIAAAHEKGVLHRDLKPGNIMLDERGVARILDFGLAALHSDIGKTNVAEGTPAYMAPEQLTGKEVSVRSDIYAFGLVLYEIFTGKVAFDAKSTAEVMRQRQTSSTPSAPSSVVDDVNPAIERVILHCLEPDPNNRPPSALAVAAALPGGDPLAAALAAGETPSPELLAAAGASIGLRPAYALACLIAIFLAIVAVAAMNDYGGFTAIVPLPRSPQQLIAKSREIAGRLGYKEQPYVACGFRTDSDFTKYIQEHDKSPARWQRLSKGHPSGIYFWYRESPKPLIPMRFLGNGRVSEGDPHPILNGMTTVILQPDGVLEEFDSPTPQVAEDAPARPVDWRPVFEMAALDPARFKPTKSQWTPRGWGDLRAAWTGQSPEQSDLTMRLEAAAFQGKTIAFHAIFPWTEPTRDVSSTSTMKISERVTGVVYLSLILGLFVIAAILARRNFRLGRGDRRGAFRFALALASIRFLASTFSADHVWAFGELLILLSALTTALLAAAAGWLLYIGIEPYARRRWPKTLVSWNRLLLGQTRDALVGRDILIGMTAGSVLSALSLTAQILARSQPAVNTSFLTSVRQGIGGVFSVLSLSLVTAVGLYVFMFVLRFLTRRDWIAGAVFILVNVIPIIVLVPEKKFLVGTVSLIANTIAVYLWFRFGIVVLMSWNLAALLLANTPMTLNLSAWYGANTLFSAAVILIVAFYAFRVSLAGRPLFSEALLET